MSAARSQSEPVLTIPGVWRARTTVRRATVPTGYAALDAVLPGAGWMPGTVAELHVVAPGVGELRLVTPGLARTAAASPVVFIDPPTDPGIRALQCLGLAAGRLLVVRTRSPRDHQWAAEQMLRAGAMAAVLLWRDTSDPRAIRRLQLAAEAGGALAFVFTGTGSGAASPAALRLRVTPTAHQDRVRVDIFKRLGARIAPFDLDLPGALACPPSSVAAA